MALGPQRGLRAASLSPSARPPGKDGPKAPKGRKARSVRAGRRLPARARHEGSVTQAAGSGETGVDGPGKQCPARRTQQEPKHLRAHSAPGLPPGQPWSRCATRSGLSRSSPQFGGLTAPVRVFPRVSRPQGATPKRARQNSRGESLAPSLLRFPAAAQAPSVPHAPPTPHAGSSRTAFPVAVPRYSRRPGPAFRALLPPPRARRSLPATPKRD